MAFLVDHMRLLCVLSEDFIISFLDGLRVYARPVDSLNSGNDELLFTEDHAGVVYFVYRKQ